MTMYVSTKNSAPIAIAKTPANAAISTNDLPQQLSVDRSKANNTPKTRDQKLAQ